jgi:two-component system sensor histidine kinase KdpD
MKLASLQAPAAGIVVTLAATGLLTLALAPFDQQVGSLNAVLLFLLLTLLISAVWGRGVGLLAALLSNLAFNYFFIAPQHTLTVQEPSNVFGLAIFLLVSAIGGTLLAATRQGAEEARLLQAETRVSLELSHAMSRETSPQLALQALCRELVAALNAPSAAVLTQERGVWAVLASAGNSEGTRAPDNEERAAADRAANERVQQRIGHSGLGDSRRPRIVIPSGRSAAYLVRDQSTVLAPLILGDRVVGMLRLDGPIGDTPFRNKPRRLLDAAASEAAVALERVELAQAAAHTQALQETDKLKTALLTAISHDLKTPLAMIKAASSSILDPNIEWSAEDLQTFYGTIDSQTDQLSRLIGDILDLNRIEEGAIMPEQSVVRPVELLRQARSLTLDATRGREVTVAGPEDLRATVDEALILHALMNLIENSVKYSKPSGAIHLTVEPKGGLAIIVVEDEGPGIAPEDLPHVFERFYRAGTRRSDRKGSGLGLAIVKAFVELCGGEVSVSSSADSTRFSLSLPAAKPAKVPA